MADTGPRILRIAMAAGLIALAADPTIAAEPSEAISEQAAPDTAATPSNVDPVTEVVQGDALTQIRISAISFRNPKNLGQALSGVIGAFLKRDRMKDAMVDLTVIHDPVWRANALLHFAEYHYGRGETDTAFALLQQADELTRKFPAQSDETTVLSQVSQRQAEYGNYAAARKTAARITGPEQRVAKFIELAELQGGDSNRKIAAGGAESFRLAFDEVKKATLGKEERLALLIQIANHAIALGYRDLAQQILEFGVTLDTPGPAGDRPPIIAQLAAGMVRAGARGRAMEIVRALKNDIRRGYALASVARGFAATGSIEGAVQLFYLAIQDADSQVNKQIKTRLLAHILNEQTHAGRLADAFNTAGKIKDPDAQQTALFGMAGILFENGKPLEALKIADYLPDPGMRAQVLGTAARFFVSQGDIKMAEELLQKAITPTGAKPDPGTLAIGLPLIFEAQLDMKKSAAGAKILAGARSLLELIPDEPAKVPVMTRIARAEMRAQEKDAAERSLGMAWRIAWFNKDKDVFPELLSEIAMAQLNIGELLLAFDTAARISENSAADINELEALFENHESPKVKTLTAIAVAAARLGEGQLALRAARAILDPSGRAAAYRRIALAFPAENQQANLGRGTVPMHPDASKQAISPAVLGSPMPVDN